MNSEKNFFYMFKYKINYYKIGKFYKIMLVVLKC